MKAGVDQIENMKNLRAGLLTRRELAQLHRAVLLLDRVFARRCVAMGFEPGYGEEDGDEIAWSAAAARARIEMLIDGDDEERKRLGREAERLEFDLLLDGGDVFDKLAAVVEKKSGTDASR